MSEFQYYEFLALDRPLSVEDMAYVSTLSSRVEPTPSHAVFTYFWGDFRGNPLDLLAKHYDIMLYLANWGSRQLTFRFPKDAIDQVMLQPYYYGVDEIELTPVGDYLILDIAFHDEGGDSWLEDEPHLARSRHCATIFYAATCVPYISHGSTQLHAPQVMSATTRMKNRAT